MENKSSHPSISVIETENDKGATLKKNDESFSKSLKYLKIGLSKINNDKSIELINKISSVKNSPNKVLGSTITKYDEIDFKTLTQLLNKNSNERTQRDISFISSVLESSSKLAQLIENNSVSSELESSNNIMYFMSKYLKYRFLNNDQFLFYEGEIGDKFYFILKGSVNIIKSIEKQTNMNIEKYLEYLSNIKTDKWRLNLVVKSNKNIFPINQNHVDEIDNILLLLKNKKNIENSNNHNDLIAILNQIEMHQKKEIFEKNINPEKINLLKLSSINQINQIIDKYDLILNHLGEQTVKIYENTKIVTLHKGEYFGDVALQRKSMLRTASVQGNEDCHLGYIESDEYKQYILKIKQGIEMKLSDIILKRYFFQSISNKVFYTLYFHYFSFKEVKKGKILQSDTDQPDFVYFVKEGEIEYLYDTSINGLIKIIKSLCKQFNVKYKLSTNEEIFIKDQKNMKYLEKLRHFKIYVGGADHIGGLSEYYFGLKNQFQAKVSSSSLKYFSLTKINFVELMKSEPQISKKFESSSLLKQKGVIERLIDIKNSTIDRLEKKIAMKMKIVSSNFKSDRRENPLPRISLKNPDNELEIMRTELKTPLNLKTINHTSKKLLNVFQPLSNSTSRETSPKKKNETSKEVQLVKRETSVKAIKSVFHQHRISAVPQKLKSSLRYEFVNSKNNVGAKIHLNDNYSSINSSITKLSENNDKDEFELKMSKRYSLSKDTRLRFSTLKISDNSELKKIVERSTQIN